MTTADPAGRDTLPAGDAAACASSETGTGAATIGTGGSAGGVEGSAWSLGEARGASNVVSPKKDLPNMRIATATAATAATATSSMGPFFFPGCTADERATRARNAWRIPGLVGSCSSTTFGLDGSLTLVDAPGGYMRGGFEETTAC